MPIQAILDATANIAGGALLRTGIYKGAGGIAGVKIAYSLPPEEQSLAEDGPTHVSFFDGFPPVELAAGDLTVFRHRIRMQLMLAVGRSELPKAYSILTPFVELYRDAFAAKLKLNGTASASIFDSCPGIVDAIYPNRIALEMVLIAVEKVSVAYAA